MSESKLRKQIEQLVDSKDYPKGELFKLPYIFLILDKAKQEYFRRVYQLTPEQEVDSDFMRNFSSSIKRQVEILRSIKKETGYVNGEELLWLIDYFGEI